MNINQYNYTNRWYESDGWLIKDFEIKNGNFLPVYLNSAERKEFFKMKYSIDHGYKRNVRIKKLRRIMTSR